MNQRKNILLLMLLWAGMQSLFAQQNGGTFPALGAPQNPKVPVAWNRYYDYEGITQICRQLQEAFPNLVKLTSIGKSYQGRDLWVLSVTNYKVGEPSRKPGFYIDGNIHSNEIQGTETALYTAWYLCENFGNVEFITRLLTDKIFYIVPTINPDGRENFMKQPNTMHSPRSGVLPVDDDGDGLSDEDDYDDLNGDGHITQMRIRRTGGRYIPDPADPRLMKEAPADQPGIYDLLEDEGFDNDGDGKINEDREGFYDPNRDWAWNWQPSYVQNGAHKYPFSIPENAAVRDFIYAHPNIAGAQSYHNAGGMILRGPGAKEEENAYPQPDKNVYNNIAQKGAKMLPGYNDWVISKDLYNVYGGEINFFHGARGIFSFTNELWSSTAMFNQDYKQWYGEEQDNMAFDKLLLFEEAFVPWKEYDHPVLGKVEIGGFKKTFTRINPGFMLENDAHRNMAFTLYHASQMPALKFDTVFVKELQGSYREITVRVFNGGMIPTHSNHDIANKIERPDWFSLEGQQVVAGMQLVHFDTGKQQEQAVNPARVNVSNIPGMGVVEVKWVVKGRGPFRITVDSAKGGMLTYEGGK